MTHSINEESNQNNTANKAILASVLQSISNPMLIVNDKGDVIDYNSDFINLFKIPTEILTAKNDKNIFDYVKEQVLEPEQFVNKIQIIYNNIEQVNDTILFKDGRIIDRQFFPLVESSPINGSIWIFRDVTHQKKNEEIFELFKISIDNANDAVYWLNDEGRFEYINDIGWKRLGYSRDEMMSLSIWDIDPRESRKSFKRKWQDYQESKRQGRFNIKFESQHKRKNGTLYPVEVSVTHFWKNNKEYHIAHIRDISDRKREEDILLQSERKYRMLFENINNSFALQKMIFDEAGECVDGIYVEVNPVFEKYTGMSKEGAIGKNIKELFPNTEDYWMSFFGNVAKTGKSDRKIDYSIELDSYYEIYAFCPEPGYCAQVSYDVTERIKNEEALRRSEEKYRMLFENMPNSFSIYKSIFDKNGKPIDYQIVEVNPVFEKFVGLSASDVIGKNVKDILPKTEDYWIQTFGKVSKTGIPIHYTNYSVELNRYYEVFAYSPEKGYCAVIFNDVTDRIKNEEALRESKEKYRLLFENMTSAFALHEMIYDDNGDPIDYRYLEVNPAFERMTGIAAKKWIGHTIKEVLPGTEEYWIKAFGKVAKTGEPIHYVNYSNELGKHFDAIVYSPDKDCFAVIFTDVTERVENEIQLKKFKTSIDNSLEGVFWINEEGGFDYVNEQASKMLGYSHDELMQLKLEDIDPEGNHDEFIELWGKLYNSEDFQSFSTERTHKRKDGSRFPIELNSIFLKDPEKSVLISNTQDITERKQNEKALVESEARARLFVENTPLPIALFDNDLNYIVASKQWYHSYNMTDENVVGKNHYALLPETTNQWKDLYQRAQKGEVIKCDKDKFERKDGSVQWVRYGLYPWFKNDRTIGGIIVYSEDITHKIEAEKALEESEKKVQRLFDIAPVGMGIIKDRTVIDVNPQVCKITGYSKEELIGLKTQFAYKDEDEFERVGKMLYKEMEEKGIGRIETIWITKDKTQIEVNLAITLLDPEDPSKGSIFTVMDITKSKNYEAALEKRVLALTRPIDELKDIEFTDLFNLDELQKLQDTISKAIGVASIITHPNGVPITKPSNFCQLCTLIRSTPKGEKNCIASDAKMGSEKDTETQIHHCISAGLWDASARITLGGVHIANWLVGQVRNDATDEIKLMQYANEIGIDEQVYKEALKEVKYMSTEQFKLVTEAYYLLAKEISIKSYQNLQQARFIAEQKKIEEELLKNQKLLLESQRIAKIGSWDLDLLTYKLVWNKETFNVYEIEDSTIEPNVDYFFQLIHPDDRELIRNHLRKVIDGDESPDIECRMVTPKGKLKYILIAGELLYDENKKPINLYGIVQDITQQKNNEAQILKEKEKAEESEKRFKSLHNASFGGIGIHDNGIILDCNHGLSDITGYSYDELIGMNGLLLIANDHRDEVMQNIKSGYEQPYESVGCRKNGELYPLRIEGKNIPYKGKIVRVVEFRDITKDKEIEKQIIAAKERAEESEYFLKESQRIGKIGSFKMFYKDGYWISTSSLDEILGLEPAEKRKIEEWIEMIYAEDRDEIVASFRNELLAKKVYFDKEYRILRKNDGVLRWARVTGRSYFQEGNLDIMLGTFQDVTERHEIEEKLKKMNILLEQKVEQRTAELKQANKDLESFSYSVSHDLRAPIRHIDGFLQLLQKQLDHPKPGVMNYLHKIDTSTKNMSVLIDELLKFSRLGRTEITFNKVDLNQIIKDIIEQFKPDYEKRKIHWEIEQLPSVIGDSALLKIALENLLSNAIKYTSKKDIAVIEVKEYKEDSHFVTFIVKDNGAGFDMSYKEKLFGVFQRLHKNEEFEGVGIGLANVKKIINKHKGDIEAEGESGQGATFYITLPK